MTLSGGVAGSSLRGSMIRLPGHAGRWAWRVASEFALPVVQEVATLVRPTPFRDSPVWADPPFDAGGLPVLLVGGLASTASSLLPLHDWLARLNFRPAISPIRYGVDCGERTAAGVADALAGLVDSTGRRAAVVAHSRGGHFARAVAVRHPDLLECLVTLGSPVNRMLGIHPLLLVEVGAIGLMGSLGVPGLMRSSCLFGRCCRRMREDLFAPFPRQVPFLSVYSREDRLVDWRSCVDPQARHREVRTTHGGLVCSPTALTAVVEELHRVLQAPDARPRLATRADVVVRHR
jgi:pimeloyl-ACP methyl ester carboxylesterase